MDARQDGPIGVDESQEAAAPRTRRQLLAAAMAAAGGALAARALGVTEPVEAANGSTVRVGQVNSGTATTTIRNTASSSSAVALKGVVTRTGSGSGTAGVFGQSAAQDGRGVVGYATRSGSDTKGVYGRSRDGRGVYGRATGTTGVNYGVYGESMSSIGTGVYGVGRYGIQGIGSTYGAWGDSDHIGVVGMGTNFGVYGNGNVGVMGIGDTWAGSFDGDVRVYDNLTVGENLTVSGTKMFVIDHPQDPANRTLAHSCVEAPEMLNVYRGNVTLDARGRATVRLPRYFRSLNADYSYQLTPVGDPAPDLHVARKIERSSFRIAGGVPDQEVCWQVTGARRDAWARAHPMRVDRVKRRRDRGMYLDPQVHGQPQSAAIHRPSELVGPGERRRPRRASDT